MLFQHGIQIKRAHQMPQFFVCQVQEEGKALAQGTTEALMKKQHQHSITLALL
jgi:hypothetical protein